MTADNASMRPRRVRLGYSYSLDIPEALAELQ